MKIFGKKSLQMKTSEAWKHIIDFNALCKWHSVFEKLEGKPEPDSIIQMHLLHPVFGKFTTEGEITAVMKEKYFSITWKSLVGAWWYNEEYVIRLKQTESGCDLFHEIFLYGLKFRFGRSRVENLMQTSMDKIIERFPAS